MDKVFLTNTVYPLKGEATGVRKPRFRLVGKRSPEYALRVVAATFLETIEETGAVARFAPGGECFQEFFLNQDSAEAFEGLFGEMVEVSSLGSGLFVEKGECSGDEEEQPDLDDSSDGLPGLKFLNLGSTDEWEFSEQECTRVLEQNLDHMPVARRTLLCGKGRAVLLGLYGVGGFHGISKATVANPELTRYLNGFVRSQDPNHLWTTLYVSKSTLRPLHRDLRNARGFPVLVRAVGRFVGGGLWIEGVDHQGCSGRVLPGGGKRFGAVYDIHSHPVVFSGERWHMPEEWEGESRWVIAAFTPRDYKGTTEEQWDTLRDLGFPVQGVKERAQSSGEGPGNLGEKKVACSLEEKWDIGIPTPIADDWVREGLVKWHEDAARLCRLWFEELSGNAQEVDDFSAVASKLTEEESKTSWLEEVLVGLCSGGFTEGSLRTLQTDVPLNPEDSSSDMFLQTRTIGLAEARRELSCWKDPAQEEVSSLEVVNRAVERVRSSTVEEWIAQGITVVQLPGKAVLTRKSGTGKRRFRAVCCGNHLPTDKLGLTKEELYASGAESLSVKVAITFAARHKNWIGVTIDVKSAFLYAPIWGDTKGTDERIIVKPPYLLVELGLLGKDDRRWVRKALYGLPTSPRDWGRYRDAEFQKIRIAWQDREYCLVQTKTDDALWLLRELDANGMGSIAGVLVVYVDDLAVFAPKGLAKEFILAIQTRWKTSEPEWLGSKPVTFCGIELSLLPTGYRMSQCAYIRELLNRYGIEEHATAPILKWVEPERVDNPSVEEVREAQGLTGALLWVSTRTRPDLAYAVSRCGQQATKAPQWSISCGRQALGYLKSTLDFGIDVPFVVGGPFSEHGLLSLPRSEKLVLELYCDASHAPGGDRSMQAVFIVWEGVPLTWEASRQPFTTLSSAESELVAMMHGVQLAESVQPLIDEVIQEDSIISLMGDNEAAIRSFQSASASWRNRHLRMRAVSGRERIEAGLLHVSHLPGEFQIADVATKPLTRSRLFQLLELMNIRGPVVASESVGAARVLSRLTLPSVPLVGSPAELLAGLAMLATIPQVTGQPLQERLEYGSAWLVWTLGVVLLGVCLVWGWWLTVGCGTGSVVLERQEPLEEEVSDQPVKVFQEEDPRDPFTDAEWAEAQAKLIAEEVRVGLTFVQRARVRRIIASGGVLDPPVFQQRHGPLPEWFTGPDPAQSSSFSEFPTPVSGAELVIGFLTDHGELVVTYLGYRLREWTALVCTARAFRSNAKVALFLQLSDTGRASSFLGPGWHVELQFVETRDGGQWLPVTVRHAEDSLDPPVLVESEDGFEEDYEPSSPEELEVHFEGSSGLPGSSTSDVHFGGSSGIPGSSSSEVHFGGSSGIPGSSTSEVHFGGSSGIPGSSTSEVHFGGSSGIPGSSTSEVHFGGSFGILGSAIAEVQFGGSASSTDQVLRPRVFTGSSTGSEMSVQDQGEYEDLFDFEVEGAQFPIVGTWLREHFMSQLLSLVGSSILWFLGEGSWEWLSLRLASLSLRTALVGALADVWRQGPNAYLFEGPQWYAAVEDHMCVRAAVRWADNRRAVGWDAADAYFQADQGGNSVVEWEDEWIEGRKSGESAQEVSTGPPVANRSSSTSSAAESSVTEPSVRATGSLSEGTLGLVAELLDHAEGSDGAGLPQIAYSALEEALLVHYGDDSLTVPLPGWTVEAVQQVIQGLETGVWPEWQRALEGVNQPSESIGAAFQDATGAEIVSASQGGVGLSFGGLVVFWFRVVIVLWVCICAAQGTSELVVYNGPPDEVLDPVCSSRPLQVCSPSEDGFPGTGGWCDGSVLEGIAKIAVCITLWELSRRCFCQGSGRKAVTCEVASQTGDLSIVPLPLPAGVPSRAKILFCLWKAGFKLDTESYPEGVQNHLDWLIGDYLRRLEDGEVSEGSSSG